MSFILNIDTAVQTSSICLAENGRVLASRINPSQKDSASWLHIAIKELFTELNVGLHQLEAIAVSAGPGSYTGLRVGMSTAKGLCYSLKIPLITINTLQQMAFAARKEPGELLCPMIDARRMEVFTAVYDFDLMEVIPASNVILEHSTYSDLLKENVICFFGNGSDKFRPCINHPNALFRSVETTAESMNELSFTKLKKRDFADVAYLEPYYGKDFHSKTKESL